MEEESSWNHERIYQPVREASDFTYLFAHDIKTVKRGKPLIKVASQEERAQPATLYHNVPNATCLPCSSVHLYHRERVDHVIEHLQDV